MQNFPKNEAHRVSQAGCAAAPGDVLFFVCGAVSESVLVSFSVVRG